MVHNKYCIVCLSSHKGLESGCLSANLSWGYFNSSTILELVILPTVASIHGLAFRRDAAVLQKDSEFGSYATFNIAVEYNKM